MAADSTMLRMVNRLIALSLGVHREQLEQRIGLTWPRPFLLRPLWKTHRGQQFFSLYFLRWSGETRISNNESFRGGDDLRFADSLQVIGKGGLTCSPAS